MAGAARVAIAERGRIPAEYALLATGGAGPVHAWQVARKLGVSRVVCPPGAGAGSTIGMLMAPARVDRVASFNAPLAGADYAAAEAIFAGLEAEALVVLRADRRRRRTAAWSGGWPTCATSARAARSPSSCPMCWTPPACAARFEAAYRALFARTPPGAAAQFVALRLSRHRAHARRRQPAANCRARPAAARR